MFYVKQKGNVIPITPPTIDEPQVPVGTVLHYAGADEPEGWLICDGRELDASIYEALFAAIGYTYGGSNGKFKLPDFRETAAVGVGTRSSSVDVYSLGQFKNDQIASHTHTQTSHTHTATAHCHPTAVSHTHNMDHCHSMILNWGAGGYACNASNENWSCHNICTNIYTGNCCWSDYAAVCTCATTAPVGSYAAHNSGSTTATNCNTGASTGTRGRRIALNFIIFAGGKK